MFKHWMNENKISDFTFSTRLFPKACDRAFWEKSIDEIFVKYAEEHLGCEWPTIRATQYMAFQTSGDRKAQENPHFKRRLSLLTLFVGELKEHKGRFLPDICDGIFAICEETFWGLSAHVQQMLPAQMLPYFREQYIDLNAAETGELISVIYHILYDEIKDYCPPLLSRMEYELDRRIIKPYMEHTDFWWMGYNRPKVNNWNPWTISNVLTVFLTLPLDSDTRNHGIEKMMTEIQHFYNLRPDDGGCDEGCQYWAVSGGKLFTFCDQLYIATDGRINLFHDRKFENIMRYELKAYIGGSYFVNYGDGNARINARKNANLVYALYAFGLRINDREYCRFVADLLAVADEKPHIASGSSAKSTLWSLIFAKDIAAQDKYTPKGSCVLPCLQHAYIHNGEWFCALKGGHNAESHNHNDVGNFMVYCDAKPVLLDAGCGTYTKDTFSSARYTIWTMQSGYHNLPVINGVSQMNGRDFGANGFEADGNTASVSFAAAYPETAGVLNVARTTEVTKQGVTVRDNFMFANETNTVEEHFMTLLKPEITEQGVVLGEKYLLKTDLPIKIDYKSFDGDRALIDAWDCDGVYRIIIHAECQKNASFEFEIRRF